MSGYKRRESYGCSNRASKEYDEHDNFSTRKKWDEEKWEEDESRNARYDVECPTDGQNVIEQLQREAEMELEKALKILRATERVLPPKKTRDSSRYQKEECPRDEESESDMRKMRFNRPAACLPKKPAKPCLKPEKKSNEKNLPRRPDLTNDELRHLLEAEKKDVDLALSLASDAEEVYKKPCPKQQKAKQSIKEMVGTKTATRENLSKLIQFRELMELEPEDMSPDMIATIIFSQEKGVLLDSSPQNTVKHLFPDKSKKKGSLANKDELGFIYPDDPAEETETVDESKSQEKRNSFEGSSEFYVDAPEEMSSEDEEPRYFNKVQLRGSTPQWCPGYLAIFPEGGENIHLAKSPSEVFQKAWVSTTPSEFPSPDIFIIQ